MDHIDTDTHFKNPKIPLGMNTDHKKDNCPRIEFCLSSICTHKLISIFNHLNIHS